RAAGRRGDCLVRVDARHELVARPCLRAGVGTDFFGIRVRVAEAAEPSIGQRLVQSERQRVGVALVRVAEAGGLVGVVVVVAAALVGTRIGAADVTPVAAAAIGHLARRTVVEAGVRVVGASSERTVGRSITSTDPLGYDRTHYAAPRQLVVAPQAGLPHGRQLEVGIDGVDGETAPAGTRDVLAIRVRAGR